MFDNKNTKAKTTKKAKETAPAPASTQEASLKGPPPKKKQKRENGNNSKNPKESETFFPPIVQSLTGKTNPVRNSFRHIFSNFSKKYRLFPLANFTIWSNQKERVPEPERNMVEQWWILYTSLNPENSSLGWQQMSDSDRTVTYSWTRPKHRSILFDPKHTRSVV